MLEIILAVWIKVCLCTTSSRGCRRAEELASCVCDCNHTLGVLRWLNASLGIRSIWGSIDHTEYFQTQYLYKHMDLLSVTKEVPIGYPVLLIANCLQNDSPFTDLSYFRKQTEQLHIYQGWVIWAKGVSYYSQQKIMNFTCHLTSNG